jgi:hypothetical protein
VANSPNKGSGSASAPPPGPAIQSTNGQTSSTPSKGPESRNWPGQRQSPYPPRSR